MEHSETTSNMTIVLGDLTGWHPRLVYRTVQPRPVDFSDCGDFAQLDVRGVQRVGAVVTPEDSVEPVVYLGPSLPTQPLTAAEGWEPVDMPAGVVAEPVEIDVVAITVDGEQVSGWANAVWLPRHYRPMERIQLPIGNLVGEPLAAVPARVLEASRIVFQDGPSDSMVVVVDDPAVLVAAGWVPQSWVGLRAEDWAVLHALSHSIETHAVGLLNSAITMDVTVHDLAGMDIDALVLLPRDVRDGLERALISMPD